MGGAGVGGGDARVGAGEDSGGGSARPACACRCRTVAGQRDESVSRAAHTKKRGRRCARRGRGGTGSGAVYLPMGRDLDATTRERKRRKK